MVGCAPTDNQYLGMESYVYLKHMSFQVSNAFSKMCGDLLNSVNVQTHKHLIIVVWHWVIGANLKE